MNTFLFTQITNTLLGVLIIAEIICLLNKKMKWAGIMAVVLAAVILMIGVITPISIVLCAAVALVMFASGLLAIKKNSKAKETDGV